MKLNNKIAVISIGKKYKDYLIRELNKKNVENIDEILFFVDYKGDIYRCIEKINELDVDFIIIEEFALFKDFEKLQEKSNVLILNPLDTLASYLIADLNKFPIWTLDSKLGISLLERYNIAYQVLDKNSKEVLNTINNSNINDILVSEIEKYKNIGIDSIVLNDLDLKIPTKLKDIDIYEINAKYLQKTLKILFL